MVGVFELYFLHLKFYPHQPDPYHQVSPLGTYLGQRIAVEYGQHGAWFVRVGANETFENRIPAEVTGELLPVMSAELRRIPFKVAFELLLYTVVLWFAFLGIWVSWSRFNSTPLRASASALVIAVGTVVLQLPVALRYGSSALSTWAGPGAYSFSSQGYSITWVLGETVAHRVVVEALNVGAYQIRSPVVDLLTYVDIWLQEPGSWLVAGTLTTLTYAAVTFFLVGVSSMLAKASFSKPGGR